MLSKFHIWLSTSDHILQLCLKNCFRCCWVRGQLMADAPNFFRETIQSDNYLEVSIIPDNFWSVLEFCCISTFDFRRSALSVPVPALNVSFKRDFSPDFSIGGIFEVYLAMSTTSPPSVSSSTSSSHRAKYKNTALDASELRRRREEEGVQGKEKHVGIFYSVKCINVLSIFCKSKFKLIEL